MGACSLCRLLGRRVHTVAMFWPRGTELGRAVPTHFGCPSMEGVALERDVDAGTDWVGSHWSEALFGNREVMLPLGYGHWLWA